MRTDPRVKEPENLEKFHIRFEPRRPHELTQTLQLLKILAKEPKNTMAMYRQLRRNAGFRNHHAFYRQLNLCLNYGLIELSHIQKKWGIPTKTYSLTEKGKSLLRLMN